MLIRQILDDIVIKDLRFQLIFSLGPDPFQDRLARSLQIFHLVGMQFQQSELAFGIKDAWFHFRRRLQRQIGDAVDRQGWGDFDDQRMLTRKWGVSPRPCGRGKIGRELGL